MSAFHGEFSDATGDEIRGDSSPLELRIGARNFAEYE
jgi:hypothetical protein